MYEPELEPVHTLRAIPAIGMLNNPKNVDRALLRCFDALMIERSVSRAADRLGIGQPTMSNALGRLRVLFGDPLLLRGRTEMIPTARALALLEPLRTILTTLDDMLEEQPQFDPATSQGTIKLTALDHVEHILFPALARRLQRDAPLMRVETRSVNPEKALDWLERGDVDCRVGWLRDPPSSFHVHDLYRDNFVCIQRADHPCITDTLTLQQFTSLAHVCVRSSAKSEYWRVLSDAFTKCSTTPPIAFIVQDFVVVPQIVSTTDLIATVPERFARSVANRFALRIFKPPINLSEIRVSMYWHERAHKIPMHRWFRSVLADISHTL